MSLDSNAWATKFGNKAVGSLAAFMTTYNMVSQQVAFAGVDPATSGGGDCTINGVYIPALTAEADANWDSTSVATSVEGNALGEVVPDLYSVYLAVFADADGRLKIDLAGEIALDAAVELKIPWFDPSEWCCIGIVLLDSAGTTLGTTNINGVIDVYNVIGPVLPHPSNLPI